MLLTDLLNRFWEDILARPSGPLAFRFVLQPMMAIYLASRDGWHDAEHNRTPYLWTVLHDRQHRRSRLHEGVVSTTRLLLLTAAIDLLYQVLRLGAVRPLETLVITFFLAFVPYVIVRGPAARISRHVIAHRQPPAAPTGGTL